jgi:hypothetical protein
MALEAQSCRRIVHHKQTQMHEARAVHGTTSKRAVDGTRAVMKRRLTIRWRSLPLPRADLPEIDLDATAPCAVSAALSSLRSASTCHLCCSARIDCAAGTGTVSCDETNDSLTFAPNTGAVQQKCSRHCARCDGVACCSGATALPMPYSADYHDTYYSAFARPRNSTPGKNPHTHTYSPR